MEKIFPCLETAVVEHTSGIVKSEMKSYAHSDCLMKKSSAIDMETFNLEVSFVIHSFVFVFIAQIFRFSFYSTSLT